MSSLNTYSNFGRVFSACGNPVLSVDTKKKELVGQFKNQGRSWSKTPVKVVDHDFRSQAKGIATPYGIYDVGANRGSVYVGIFSGTPEFATDCLCRWYEEEGQYRYPYQDELLVLADSGGRNGYQIILNYISTTTTATGLKVRACLNTSHYTKGKRITDGEMAALSLKPHDIQPERNYTIIPNAAGSRISNHGFDRWARHTDDKQPAMAKSGSYF